MSVPEEAHITFPDRQLQRKFKHAKYFGVEGGYSPARAAAFRRAMQAHVDDPDTMEIRGALRGAPVAHYVNTGTGLNVVKDLSTGAFISGWKLSAEQLRHVLDTGKLGGG